MKDVITELKKNATKSFAKQYQSFFKTGKGEYSEQDIFLGVRVPIVRKIAKQYYYTFLQIQQLLHSPIHEVRMAGIFMLVYRFEKEPKKSYELYVNNFEAINNWDLVDLSADKIVGAYLFDKNRAILKTWAKSDHLWTKRIAIVSTYYFIKRGQYSDTTTIVEMLMNDSHDLIHKACGWMLREVGKKDEQILRDFLDKYCTKMPRTMLRYAIEKLHDRKTYLNRS